MAEETRKNCVYCDRPVQPRPLTVVTPPAHPEEPAKLWSIPVYVCTNEQCLERQGATWVEHRENRSGHG